MYKNPTDPRSFVYVSNTDPKLGVERNWAHPGIRFWVVSSVLLLACALLVVSWLVHDRILPLVGQLLIFLTCIVQAVNQRGWANADLARYPGAPGHRGSDGVSAAEEPEPMTFARQLQKTCVLVGTGLIIMFSIGTLVFSCDHNLEATGMFFGFGLMFTSAIVGLICIVSGLYYAGFKCVRFISFYVGLLLLAFAVLVSVVMYREKTGLDARLMNGEETVLRNASDSYLVLDEKGDCRAEVCVATHGKDAYLAVKRGKVWYGGKDLYTAFPICRGHFRIQEHANGLYCGVLTITAEKYNVAEGVMDWYSLYNTNGVWWIRTCRPPDQDARYCLESLKELQTAESAEGQWRIDSILPELKSRGLLCGSDESEFAGCVRLKTCYLLAFRHSGVGEYYVRVAIPSGEAHRVRVPGGKLDLMAYPRCPFASRYLPIRNDSETWIYLWDSESEDIVSGPNPSARFCRSCGHETFLSEDGNGHLYVWRAPQDDFKHWRKDERFVYRVPKNAPCSGHPCFLAESVIDGHQYAVGYGAEVLPESQDAVEISERVVLKDRSFLEVGFKDGGRRLYVRPTDGLPREFVNGIPMTGCSLSADHKELIVVSDTTERHIPLP